MGCGGVDDGQWLRCLLFERPSCPAGALQCKWRVRASKNSRVRVWAIHYEHTFSCCSFVTAVCTRSCMFLLVSGPLWRLKLWYSLPSTMTFTTLLTALPTTYVRPSMVIGIGCSYSQEQRDSGDTQPLHERTFLPMPVAGSLVNPEGVITPHGTPKNDDNFAHWSGGKGRTGPMRYTKV